MAEEQELMQRHHVAVEWAWVTRSPTGQVVRERISSGGGPVTDVELAEIRREWEAAGRPVPEPHLHRNVVTFTDGTSLTAVSFFARDPYGRESAPPTFGLYLDERWSPRWSHAHVPWPDFGVPDADELRRALEDVLARARDGEAVEVGCLGGHGRTGTALACLAVLTGTPALDAVEWVRASYCADAVETIAQRAFVEELRWDPQPADPLHVSDTSADLIG
jgi:hypothetical protein